MPASIKIIQRPHQKRADETIPIVIRVSENRKSTYIKTGYAVKESQFKEGMDNWVSKHPDRFLINAAIEQKRSELMQRITKADMRGEDLVIKDRKYITLGDVIKRRLDVYESHNKAIMYAKIKVISQHIRAAWGKDIKLSQINKELVEQYISHRLKEKAHINTLKKELSRLGTILQETDYEGKNYFQILNKQLKPIPTDRTKLSLEQIKLLEETKLYGMEDMARDIFLFAFYTHGMRIENVLTFEVANIKGDVMRYRMNKGQKVREMPMHPKLKAIIEKYKGSKPFLFPVVTKIPESNWDKPGIIGSAASMVRTHLKRAAIVCGIDVKVTPHIARHTFANLSKKRGVNMNVLKDVLGHSNIRTTEMYLNSLSDDEINQAVKGLYD